MERHVDPGPTRITYALTPKGRALADAVEAITAWAYVWNENGATHPATSAAQA